MSWDLVINLPHLHQDYITSGSVSGDQSPVWGEGRGRLSRLRTLSEEDAPLDASASASPAYTALPPSTWQNNVSVASTTASITTSAAFQDSVTYTPTKSWRATEGKEIESRGQDSNVRISKDPLSDDSSAGSLASTMRNMKWKLNSFIWNGRIRLFP